jgi:hypothetical protein
MECSANVVFVEKSIELLIDIFTTVVRPHADDLHTSLPFLPADPRRKHPIHLSHLPHRRNPHKPRCIVDDSEGVALSSSGFDCYGLQTPAQNWGGDFVTRSPVTFSTGELFIFPFAHASQLGNQALRLRYLPMTYGDTLLSNFKRSRDTCPV